MAAEEIRNENMSIVEGVYHKMYIQCMKVYNPCLMYMDSDWENGEISEKVWYFLWKSIPVEQYTRENYAEEGAINAYMQGGEFPGQSAGESTREAAAESQPFTDIGLTDAFSLQEAVIAENRTAANTGYTASGKFVPVRSPVATYSRQQLQEAGFIKETFYSEDPTTQIQEWQVQYDTLMGFDAAIKQDNSAPQILIYHTHSQEAFADSDPSNQGTTILGVGECLCGLLRDQYGFNVLHHTGQYDAESRDDAYGRAMAGLEKVLAENPSIEVIIDLHRDETNASTKLVTTVQDIPMAKFMFFNGLSYTRQLGALSSLPNPYVQDNLSFAFQMQLAAEEYYPGLTRRIYLKGYRYNLHYRPKSLLIELGSQTNTVEEAMNSCEPLAHIISMVLNGENK